MSHVRISERAERELEEIADFAEQNESGAAARILDAIHQTLLVLAENPRMGRRRSDLLPNLRIFPARRPANRYVIFYFPLDDGIEVAAVIHSSRNWEAMF